MSDATATAGEALPRPVSHTYVDDAPVLKVTGLSKRFGAGCPYCADPDARLERKVVDGEAGDLLHGAPSRAEILLGGSSFTQV